MGSESIAHEAKKYAKIRNVLKIFESDSQPEGHEKLEKVMEKSHGIC